MDHTEIITCFYTAFTNGDAETMVPCYHNDIIFEDPAFGQLKGEEACNMWRMLISRGGGNLKVTFKNIQADKDTGSAEWTAVYPYGPKKRMVTNHVKAHFEFQDNKIIRHTDHFDLKKWSRQALGLPGWLLGGTKFLQKKIQAKTNALLRKYMMD